MTFLFFLPAHTMEKNSSLENSFLQTFSNVPKNTESTLENRSSSGFKLVNFINLIQFMTLVG